MSEERTTPEAMLAHALGELEAAEAWQRIVTAAFERHQELGGPLALLLEFVHMRNRFADDAAFLARLDTMMALEAVPKAAAAFAHFASWLGGCAPQRPGSDLSAALRRTAPSGAVSVPPAPLPVALGEGEADDLVEAIVALAVPDARRELRALPYRRWALLQVRGEPSPAVRRMGVMRVSTDGLAGAAGGMLLVGAPDGPVAECWLPLAPADGTARVADQGAPAARPLPLRVAWVERAEAMGALVRGLGRRSGSRVEVFPTNEALLAADELAPFMVAVLRVHDAADANGAADELRRRAPRVAVALSRNCDHERHRADPAGFDMVVPFPLDTDLVLTWLRGLREGLPHG